MTEAQVEEKIAEIKQEQAAKIAEIDSKIKECEKITGSIDAEIEKAAAAEDLNAWTAATSKKASAINKIKMLQQKRGQVKAFDFVTAEETNKIIDSVIDHQNELEALLSAAIIEADEKINNIYSTYREEIHIGSAVKTWVKDIRPYSGEKYASRFKMRTGYNASAGKEITQQEYEEGNYFAGGFGAAGYIARDFTESVEEARAELQQGITNIETNKPTPTNDDKENEMDADAQNKK